MYRLHFTILLLAVSTVHSFSSCNRGNWNHAKNLFNSLSNDVINHDHDIWETCKYFTNFAAREVFGGNSYRIEVTCPEFHSATWDVKTKHRVLYIVGHYPIAGETCDLTYVDIKVLPHFVNTHASSWTYTDDGVFIVAFPYKYALYPRQLYCSQEIDETLIHVRRGFPSQRIFGEN